ncbi:TetR/AcrR family transcriptional regulator [Pseudomarimonas salicorniae]|uniref:TetR/AcrR family transcriptional regulator n=1 Tax=Pseudomarimonas salicorniae TaxID=2933270 RepID=A0ABT0GIS2_9GAMM|nr:TetR/AcrR family transcriptional regulator [Lysobacter sp. CAU 1642]MCK7594445.1 TetR/AcrR family transcriptional regulator [Lysobacter sp. CAU 1642]
MNSAPSKGDQTRDRLIRIGAGLARIEGLEGLTIGNLAGAASMSKSGVFAHFGSREDLQLSILDAASAAFSDRVFRPALRERRGLPRLRAIARHWLDFLRGMGADEGGCILMAAASEYDDRPGPVRDRVQAMQRRLRGELERAVQMAIDAGDLRPDSDAAQIAFELYALVLGTHHDLRLFGSEAAAPRAERAFEALLKRHLA